MKSKIIPKNLTKTQLIVYNALFITISAILKLLFEFYIPLGGFPSLRVNLTAIPIMVGGIVLGPISGFVIGIISDLVCYIIRPNGPLFLGFTISSGLTGLIPGLIWRVLKDRKVRGLKWINIILSALVITYLYASGSLYHEGSQIYFMGDPVSLWVFILVGILIILFCLFPFVSHYILKKNQARVDDLLLFTVTVEQIINSVILNTFWLSMLYGQAWKVLLPARVITNVFLIPLYTLIVAVLLQVLDPEYKKEE